jgi:hypothetical protein
MRLNSVCLHSESLVDVRGGGGESLDGTPYPRKDLRGR